MIENNVEDRAGKPQLIKATLNLNKEENKVGIQFNFMKDVDTTNYKPLLKKGVAAPESIKLNEEQKKQISNVIAQPVSDEEFKKKYDEVPDDNPVKQAAKSIFKNIGGSLSDALEKMKERDIKIDTQIEIAAKKGAPVEHVETIDVKPEEKKEFEPVPYKSLLMKSEDEISKERKQQALNRTQETNNKIAMNLTQDQRDQMIQAYNMYAQATASQGQQPISFDDYVDQYIEIAKRQQEAYLQAQQQQQLQYQQPLQYIPIVQQQPVPYFIY